MGRAKEACATVSMSVWVDPEGTNRLCYKQASGTNEKRRLNGARVAAASVLRAALRVAPVVDAALLAEHAALLASVGAGGSAQCAECTQPVLFKYDAESSIGAV